MGRIGEISGISHSVRELQQLVTPPTRPEQTTMQTANVVDPSQKAAQQASTSGQQPSPDELKHAIDDVNKAVSTINEQLQFRVHEATNVIMVRVVDTQTNKVIKEIPPEKFLDMVVKLQELVGIMVDRKV